MPPVIGTPSVLALKNSVYCRDVPSYAFCRFLILERIEFKKKVIIGVLYVVHHGAPEGKTTRENMIVLPGRGYIFRDHLVRPLAAWSAITYVALKATYYYR